MNFYFKKIFLSAFIILFHTIIHAQFTEVQIGVNGLTCSQCTRNVEMQIRKLDFVQQVQMNLEHTKGKILFVTGKKINIEKIAQAIANAGFSLRFLTANIHFNDQKSESCFEFENDMYQFTRKPVLKNDMELQFIGAKYLPKNELKKWKSFLKPSCTTKGKLYYVQQIAL